ncbi:MAG: hypothetical protein LBU34_12430 [Planctomycetaceae bacterium]|jgi:hypothetical protein|nr:hypothetical protein [Planctomycetaceae bacterium]
MKNQPKKRCWFSERNIIAAVLTAVIVYFCLIPSRLIVSPETTLITHPLKKNGTPDYFAAYSEWNNERLRNPEDNGLRMMIAAVGPMLLEQQMIMKTVPWDELPTHKNSKDWYKRFWLPLCSAMSIDPEKKPRLEYPDFHEFIKQLRNEKSGKEEIQNEEIQNEEIRNLWKQLTGNPWTVEEYPEAACWLEKVSPVLDLAGIAARKPNWACYRQAVEPANLMLTVLLPDVQASRTHVWNLQIRIGERIGRGDIDGAWYDTMTIFRIGRHQMGEPLFVNHFIDAAFERHGFEAVQEILKHGKPNTEQLKRFAEEFDHLPKRNLIDINKFPFFEKQISFDGLFHLSHTEVEFSRSIETACTTWWQSLFVPTICKMAFSLPFDRNIAARQLSERFIPIEAAICEPNPKKRRDLLRAEADEQIKIDKNIYSKRLVTIPLIRYRSRWIGDFIYQFFASAFLNYYQTMDRTQAQNDLLRIAIALERYQREHETYPESLDQLIPQWIEEIPLDIFTSRDTLTYRRQENGYLLYSYGQNEKDDKGNPKEYNDIVINMSRVTDSGGSKPLDNNKPLENNSKPVE